MLVGPNPGLMVKPPRSLAPKGGWLRRPKVPLGAALGQVSRICTNCSPTCFSSKGSFPPSPAALQGCPPARQDPHSSFFLHAFWPLLSPSSHLDKAADAYSRSSVLEGPGCPVLHVVGISIKFRRKTEMEALLATHTKWLALVLTRGKSL